jgi:hypothetical protein
MTLSFNFHSLQNTDEYKVVIFELVKFIVIKFYLKNLIVIFDTQRSIRTFSE